MCHYLSELWLTDSGSQTVKPAFLDSQYRAPKGHPTGVWDGIRASLSRMFIERLRCRSRIPEIEGQTVEGLHWLVG